MKFIRLLLLVLLTSPLAVAQDTILKTDQTEVAANVTEITTDEVKFKYFNRPDGPIYTLKKSEVFVIIYKDGTREKFGKATGAPTSPSPTYVASRSAYTAPPAPSASQSVPTAESAPDQDRVKGSGWSGNLGYGTPTRAFGESHALNYGFGFYFLGKSRMAGGMFDVDAMNFFGSSNPTYGILALNGLFRFSQSSSFYLGAGLGYATVSVKVKNTYGVEKTYSSGDLGGKAFMGVGPFRMSLILPSLGTDSGGLFTVGICTNPFK